MAVQDYFPDSEKGLILVTTRNPANKLYGTIGQHFFHFERLEPDEANELLLRAAGMPTPWNGSTKSSATQVATELGCLPLALVAAGRAILNGLSTLAKYLEYYKRRLDKVRKDYRKDDNMGDNMDDYMSVYATFEIILQGLEQKDTEEARDALQLLKIFSFFHYENIRIEILIEAANTPAREQELEEAEKKQAEATNTGPISKSWKEVLRKLLFAALEVCLRDRSYPVLPDLLRDVDLTTPFDDLRLRAALKELTQSSLITYHDTTETGFYSMHPLVHSWVRQRPSMRTWEQAIWCQAARTTLSQAILFPFPGSPGTDGALLRDLLPHIIYARQCQNEINSRILTAREKVKRWYPMLRNDNGVTQRQAREMVKFSIAYSHGGLFSEAAVLQRQVKDYVSQTLGPEHPKAMLIMLALAETYYQLGRHNDCADLHDPVLQTRLRILGPMHPDTLRSMDKLAFARCHQGRYLEGEKLSRKAIAGMTATLGANHEDTLTATDNLGRVLIRYFRAPEAIECHSRAVSGFTSLLGAEHTKTLAAKESLSVAYIETQDPALLREAHALMEEVFRSRRKTLGKEHPYSLLAKFNLARVKDALGLYAEAESLLRDAVSVATRNLGEKHLGVVAGRFRLAEVLSHRGRYEEAERMFASVTGRKWYIATAGGDGDHPDRIMALYSLVECFQRQGKWEDGLRVVKELEGVLRGRSSVHPIVDRVAARRAELEREEAGASEVRQRGEVDLAAEISSWPARQVTW
jgi:tetratricopeptide (TPR) repeat protein